MDITTLTQSYNLLGIGIACITSDDEGHDHATSYIHNFSQ